MRPDCLAIWGPIVALSICSACGTEAARDSNADGIPVIRPVVDASPLALREVLRLGDDEDGGASFFRVTGLSLDASGALYVLETASVSVFDSVGNRLRRFGREGQGPGEFRTAQTLQVVRDTVVVGDMDNRLHFFETDGTHIRTRVYQELSSDGWRTYFTIGTPDGWLLQASRSDWGGWEPGQPAPTQPPRNLHELHWLGTDGDLNPAGFLWETTLNGRWHATEGRLTFLQAPYSHGATWAVDGLGRAHVAATGDYTIDVHSPDGSVLQRLVVDVPRVTIDDPLRDKWLEQVCRPGAPCIAEQAMSLPGPEHLPVVEELWGFVAGHTAVRRSDTKPDPADPRVRGAWDLFDPDGTFLGTLPATVRPRWFDGATLLTIERGEMDVEQVVVYRVQ